MGLCLTLCEKKHYWKVPSPDCQSFLHQMILELFLGQRHNISPLDPHWADKPEKRKGCLHPIFDECFVRECGWGLSCRLVQIPNFNQYFFCFSSINAKGSQMWFQQWFMWLVSSCPNPFQNKVRKTFLLLKLRHYEKATKFEKNLTLNDKTAVFTQ